MRLLTLLVALFACLAALPAGAAEKFVLLYNGRNLEGWEGDPEVWRAQGDEIVGSTDGKKIATNSFLATKQHFKNFVLKLKFKMRNHNSGVQFRSQLHKDFVVTGYQADIADNDSMGQLWDEEGRGRLERLAPEEIARHVHPDGWNDYVITADGPHITMVLNGFKVVDYTEKSDRAATEGVIALQLHSGPAMKVEFKDIEIAELP